MQSETDFRFSTKDISLATYILFRGFSVLSFSKSNDGKTSEWRFDISIQDADRLSVEYANSDFAKYDGIRRALTKQKYI